MNRNDSYNLLKKYLKNKNLQKHCLACEAAMKALYKKLTPESKQNPNDEQEWATAGLLHDIDYEIAQNENKLDRHGALFFEDPKYTQEANHIPENIKHSIQAHNFEYTGVQPKSQMDWAIANVDALTGLIVACALIHPDRKLASIDTDFVMKRFGEKAFAKGARRESISRCEETLNIPLQEFVDTTLKAMQDMHEELGL